ncbi:Cation efflux system protein CzcC [Anaerohalosphaera lusitana]|uniref:Cation efflux system protein CzcC n=1 Tax=Anaerohalosphaera lusitana TaxID=1936003 RepID=A0A1U9NNN2_9BACT|nr:TolC family protein [Anaerohalosphaera lusitana]AQT69126.1 Cation efflux system protein CzcC [Anaerohalosphaera lusitana]
MRNFFICNMLAAVFAAGCMGQTAPNDPVAAGRTVKDACKNINIDSAVSFEEPRGELTLARALGLTLVQNPELKSFSLEVRAAQARQLQAGLTPNPELEIEVEEVGGTGESSGFDAAETVIVLSQVIELADKAQKRSDVAAFDKKIAASEYRNKKLELFSDTTSAFIAVLRAQEKLELTRELLNLSKASYDAVRKRVAAGRDTQIESDRAAIELENLKRELGQAERRLESARSRLAHFWGQPKATFSTALGDLEEITELPALEALEKQLPETPEYARWKQMVNKSRAQLKLEKARAVPNIAIGAGMQRFNETDDNAFLFGVSIPLPLSDRNQGSIKEAVYNLGRTRYQQTAAQIELHNELIQAYQELANAHAQVISLRDEILPRAERMFQTSQKAYNAGKIDYLNVLDAQRTLFDVRSEWLESLAEYHLAKTEIARLTGTETSSENLSDSEE